MAHYETAEAAVCRHDRRPIARRTDRGPRAKWFHEDGGRGCADGIHEAEPLILDADSFYTPAAGDADQYNELGEPCGDAGPGAAPSAWQPRSPEVSGRWAGATDAERAVLLARAHAEASIENRARRTAGRRPA